MMKFDFADLYTFFYYDQAVTQDEFSFDGVVKLIATVFFVSFASGLCYLNLRSWHNLHNIRHVDWIIQNHHNRCFSTSTCPTHFERNKNIVYTDDYSRNNVSNS